MQALDTIIWASPLAKAARFKVTVSDPRFADCGPAENYLVVFPRTSVWIRRADAQPFVADCSLATLYNCGQEYTRAVVHPAGDECDWFGLSPQLALELATGSGCARAGFARAAVSLVPCVGESGSFPATAAAVRPPAAP